MNGNDYDNLVGNQTPDENEADIREERPAQDSEPAFYDSYEPDLFAEEAPLSEPVEDPVQEETFRREAASEHVYHFRSDPEPIFTARPAQANPSRTQEAPASTAKEISAKKHTGGFWKKAVALALTCTLLGGAAGVGTSLLMNKLQNRESSSAASGTNLQLASPRETASINVVTVDGGKLMSANQVYKTNVNSTVGITTEIITTNFWGYQSTGAAAGSGFILTEDGYILTNQHVIDKAKSITVAMYDGKSYPATLVGYDVSNDIAVLKIDAKGLTPVTLGDSDNLEVGDEVVAIGNPLGELTFSLTKGNVSALNRAVTLSSSVTMNLIQTDAAINSGNSGGALFNMYGEVIGITNAKYSSSGYGEASIDNIGFAIPINAVRDIVTSIIEKGYISRPYIGVSVDNVSEESQSYGMPQGAAIRAVEKDSPAEKAGIQANDIVTAINGETITSSKELVKRVSDSESGDEMVFSIYRRGETLELTVTIGEKTQDALPDTQTQNDPYSQYNQNGQNGQSDSNGQSNPWGDGSGNGYDSFPWSWFFGG